MSTTRRLHVRRAGAVVALGGLGALVIGAPPAAADTTAPQTVMVDLGDLDDAGSGVFDQFDPTLGTLTAVTIAAEVSMDFDVCVTNLSEVATTVPSGNVTGEAVLTFAGGVVATSSGAMPVPKLDLAASDGGDDCDSFADSGAVPGSSDSQLTSQSGVVDTFAATIDDPARLAPYVGTGTVGFDWAPSSASTISQPSEWTIVFLAGGTGEATVSYEYEPAENPPQPPPPVPPQEPPGNPPQPPFVPPDNPPQPPFVPPDNPPQPPTNDPPQPPAVLPHTGGPHEWLVALAGLLLMAGGGLIALRRPGSDAS